MKKLNFYAGPAILPESVLNKASQACIDYENIGLSLLEISHRSAEVVAMVEDAKARVKNLLNVGDDYDVLFLQGGASSQFLMVPYNLLGEGQKAAYLDTGAWASKAIKEAKRFGEIAVVGSSKDENYNHIPKGPFGSDDYRYFHCTSNNTIYGTQMKSFPNLNCSTICDMSSDIFSRAIDGNDFDLIYAGAQKNLGPAGTTLVIVKRDILGKIDREIPTMLNYQTHIDKDSMFNTPPVFPIYVCYLTLQWIEEQGGVAAIEERNNQKAEKLYAEIDRNSMFKGSAAKEDRSYMNVCFLLNDDSFSSAFLTRASEANIVGLKGHRSVGGFRASIYNALEESAVDTLIDVMQEFERVNG